MTLYSLVLVSTFMISGTDSLYHTATDPRDGAKVIAEFKKADECEEAQRFLQKAALPNTYFACVPVKQTRKP